MADGPAAAHMEQVDRLAGNEAWGKTLAKAIEAEELCRTVVDALRPMANLQPPVGIDESVIAMVESKRDAMNEILRSEGCSEFDVECALTIWVYTLQEPAVYRAMNAALRAAANRDEGHDG